MNILAWIILGAIAGYLAGFLVKGDERYGVIGHIVLAVPSVPTFYAGLGFVVVGTGLLKPNISTIVGQIYAPEDARRDAGFSIFYMGINFGALVAPLATSLFAQSAWFKGILSSWGLDPASSWHWGFGCTAVGMLIGLISYLKGQRRLGEAGRQPAVGTPQEGARQWRMFWMGLGLVAFVTAIVIGLQASGIIALTVAKVNGAFAVVLSGIVIAFFAWLLVFSRGWTSEEKKRLIVIAVLFWGATIFWSVFEQAGSTLSLFADRSTNNVIFGYAFE